MLNDQGAVEGFGDGDAGDVPPFPGQQLIGAVGDPAGGVRTGLLFFHSFTKVFNLEEYILIFPLYPHRFVQLFSRAECTSR